MSAIAFGLEQIQAAAHALDPWLVPTPVVENQALNALAGRRVLLKVEALNVTGSFKIRGAMNKLLQLSADELDQGLVALSSGNHAQAVAQAARWLKTKAHIVMPEDAPAMKIANTRKLGGLVHLYNRELEDREAIAAALVDQHQSVLVHPFDDLQIMAGQGTAGLELASYARDHQIEIGAVAAPCSGGGLIAGVGTAVRGYFPAAQVFAVEPQAYNDHALSLIAQRPVTLAAMPPSICDALLVARPGEKTFAINQQQLTAAVTISDEQALFAVAFAANELKLVLEPGGAAALAAVLNQCLPKGSQALGVILSGGNIDPALLAKALTS